MRIRINKSYILFYLDIFLIFFVRILTSMGFPSVLNFGHYILTLIIWFLSIFDKNQKIHYIDIIIILFTICVAVSGFLNSVGFVNVFLEILLLTQPFMIGEATIKKYNNISIIKHSLFFVSFTNLLFAFGEYIRGGRSDDIKGIFIGMNAGHHVCGAVAIITILYVLFSEKINAKTVLYCIVQFFVVLMCDNKQSIAVLLFSLVVIGIIHISRNIIKNFYFGCKPLNSLTADQPCK